MLSNELVHKGGNMKTNYSSKEEIFTKAKEIVYREGVSNLSMRKLAGECYLALGTLYHYFDSKEDLVVYIIEDFWKNHFKSCYKANEQLGFKEVFKRFYDVAYSAYGEFENIFSNVKVVGAKSLLIKGKEKEQKFILKLRNFLCGVAKKDPNVKHEVFDDDFTLEEFVSMLLDIVILSLDDHRDIKNYILALISKTIY